MKNIWQKHFNDYELLDFGNEQKLEKFGNIITIRPEPFAKKPPQYLYTEWLKKADFVFKSVSKTKGQWKALTKSQKQWSLSYKHPKFSLMFNLKLTNFKHVGVFPEQSNNWSFIYNTIKQLNSPNTKVLNLFAYTGGATLAAKAAGAQITHVDSMKKVVDWAKENMASSNLNDVRWIVDDARKYVKRAIKRNEKYQGIILDPPAYGKGAKGENWQLEKDLPQLINEVVKLLDTKQSFLVLNTYSSGFYPKDLKLMIEKALPFQAKIEYGDTYLKASNNRKLFTGHYVRMLKSL